MEKSLNTHTETSKSPSEASLGENVWLDFTNERFRWKSDALVFILNAYMWCRSTCLETQVSRMNYAIYRDRQKKS